jgi:hypothetical protein
MFQLKPLSRPAIPTALEKAMRYRLLNEPGEAASICHDVLAIDSENQEALVLLLLALTDRFEKAGLIGFAEARDVLPRLRDPYHRAYYQGIAYERRAKAMLHQAGPGSGGKAFQALREAMDSYEKAEAIRPAGNDDALLRWNACARTIMANKLVAPVEEKVELSLE